MDSNKNKKLQGYMRRFFIYFVGLVLVSLGIVLCKKCNLGISPISSIPYVLEDVLPFSFGTLTMLFHLVNIFLQLALIREIWNVRILLQVPVAFLFGQVIDLLQRCVNFNNEVLIYQWIALILSVFFTALGMVLMISMNLVQNPPDGLVKVISQKTEKELGRVKIIYDITSVVISVMIGLIFLGKVKGMGIATIVSAIFVGRTVTWLKQKMKLGDKV
ncbi:MAG: YitT family protein [Dorea sp.]